jgi:hypothetical protein
MQPDTLRPVAEQTFGVRLVLPDTSAENDFWQYRGESLPQENEVIFVEATIVVGHMRARVTRVNPDGNPPIHASALRDQ